MTDPHDHAGGPGLHLPCRDTGGTGPRGGKDGSTRVPRARQCECSAPACPGLRESRVAVSRAAAAALRKRESGVGRREAEKHGGRSA